MLPLSTYSSNARRLLSINDVIFVNVSESRVRETRNGQVQDGTRVDMRIRPTVQGAAVVLENRTGRILAMAGGFSYPVSQLNRVTQSRRQPGSSFKPVVYLAALSAGTQPNATDRRRADHAAADRRAHCDLHARARTTRTGGRRRTTTAATAAP